MKILFKVLLFITVIGTLQVHSTDHGTYPASYWKIHNHCKSPILFVIENEDGEIEFQEALLPNELYQQPMGRFRTMREAERNVSFHAFQLDDSYNIIKNLDFRAGQEWKNFEGGMKIHVPYFYYNSKLDQSCCM